MSELRELDLLSIAINQEKIVKFQQWCQEQNLDINQVISEFIDSCLENKNKLFDLESDNLSKSTIDSMIALALQPLISRVENLEAQLQVARKSVDISLSRAENQTEKTNSEIITAQASEEITTENQITEPEKRKYLPRHQVWQILKQTDYAKHFGYDSFLAATPEQFVNYGIFFDVAKKTLLCVSLVQRQKTFEEINDCYYHRFCSKSGNYHLFRYCYSRGYLRHQCFKRFLRRDS